LFIIILLSNLYEWKVQVFVKKFLTDGHSIKIDWQPKESAQSLPSLGLTFPPYSFPLKLTQKQQKGLVECFSLIGNHELTELVPVLSLPGFS
jgi:hypothetical protein